MLSEHNELFDKFRGIHDKYSLDPHTHQVEFNEFGATVMETIRDWEDRLCGRSEGSGYGSFTGNLAEKFMQEIRNEFPMIDRVGIIMSSPAKVEPAFELNQITPKDSFNLKKIEL